MALELAAFSAFFLLFIILLTISVILKGVALWKAGRHNQVIWFILLFVIQTLGVLEIIYLVFFQRKKKR